MRIALRLSVVAIIIAAFMIAGFTQPAMAGDAVEIDSAVDEALQKLYTGSPAATELSKVAKAVLVFPSIIRGGLIVGGQYGEGALRKAGKEGKTDAYYNIVSASYGLQAGAQKYGFAMFFMDEASLAYLKKSEGWEIGVGPTVVMVDEGMARTLSTTTAKEGIYVFSFDQRGLMAGLGIQGSKITKITPK